MKARAPPPPGNPLPLNAHCEQKPLRDTALGPQQNLVHMKEALRNSTVDVTVVLPSGLEKKSVVNGSHAMMDLLVDLCLQNHLNPSHHALEIWSSETQQPLSFKPNTLVGTLNVHTVFLKEKVSEEKVKPGSAKVPEKSVRLVVNYLRTQKAVVRVSPEVPLQSILPVICAKCEVHPEHVVLLRDNIAGEELELSKSLNELGIKELYAWDNRRDTFRKSSLGNDETDKEKKKFLGFFKVNQRSNSKGCLTMPNSPSVHSRSISLGPSLSLGNISGVSVKSEMKKRRAPPPPASGPPVQDKASEKVSLGSQIDLQKKKRRAPAPPPPQPPPPPSPLVPKRTEDKEDNRKSTVGVGRQVPQKPPRGTARGPPLLVLPPPPPYPPPDTDMEEPLSFPGKGAGSEASDLRPKLSLPLGRGCHCGVDGPSEAEETVSVGSCYASEDTTEDSGVMSSPSDIVSLDSQHDSSKSKDRWATDQEDCSDQDLAGTPELGPQKSPSWEQNGPALSQPRTEKPAMASHDDEDLFITGQFHETLAELDEDLEEMEGSYRTDSSSLTSSLHGAPSPCAQEALIPGCGDVDTIPVTFIGEVLDDPVDLGSFSNRNNNAGSFDLEGTASRRAHLPPSQPEDGQQLVKAREEAPRLSAPSHDPRKIIKLASSDSCRDRSANDTGRRATSLASKLPPDNLNVKEKSKTPDPSQSEKTQASQRAYSQTVNENDGHHETVGSAPPPWYQRGQSPGGSYGLKYGLTTYKIVPPRSERRCYDRDASLSVGAIKIDELGNLVNPHVNGSRVISLPSALLEGEAQPIGKVKEFWRCNSMEKPTDWPPRCPAKKTASATLPAQPQPPEDRLRADPKPALPLSAPQGDRRHLVEGGSQQPTAISCHVKVPSVNSKEVVFLKPQRRTSSQYVASAIAKRIGPAKAHTDTVKPQSDAGQGCEGRVPKPTGQPTDLCVETQGRTEGAEPPSAILPSNRREEAAVGTHPRGDISSPSSQVSAQDSPSGIHRSSCFPLGGSSQRDRVSVGQSCGFNRKQSTSDRKPNSTADPTSTLASASPPTACSAKAPVSGTLVNGARWAPGGSRLPRSQEVCGSESHVGLETEERLRLLSTDVPETDGALPPSIFGPKKKFRPVVQRPAPKDTSLHSALMEAIHSAGGKDRLRKTAEQTSLGGPKTPSFTEAEGERCALLAAIRGHSGTCSLRKVSSHASEELQGFREAMLSTQGSDNFHQEDLGLPPPPALPPPPPPASQALSTSQPASRLSTGTLDTPADARQALMDAIRSGTGAARLRKVPLLV
ncbi:protein cordon-bleu isoform X2 [Tupaia chinensis]|uniref:protein cordon-bleu isoform X2 n=1 Tax=Tupaia chinensis TaxID=246437 RepID=UPI00070472AF|nr:protein cordon-bleu isoform X2 [Tupaia chinensis]